MIHLSAIWVPWLSKPPRSVAVVVLNPSQTAEVWPLPCSQPAPMHLTHLPGSHHGSMQPLSRRGAAPTANPPGPAQRKQHPLKVRFQPDPGAQSDTNSSTVRTKPQLRSAAALTRLPAQERSRHSRTGHQGPPRPGADVSITTSDSSSSSSSGMYSSNYCSSHSISSSVWSSLKEADADLDCCSPSGIMVCFLRAYGLQPTDIQRLLQECPQLFCGDTTSSTSSSSNGAAVQGSCTAGWSPYSFEEEAAAQEAAAAVGQATAPCSCSSSGSSSSSSSGGSSVYEVGRTLLFFHSLGWSHSSVLRRIVGLYPQLLTKQVDRDILPVLSALTAMGCSRADLQLLVWEFPRIFVSSNWRRHVRKFQYLGLYGLPPPGSSSSSSNAGGSGSSSDGSGGGCVESNADSLDRLLHWL